MSHNSVEQRPRRRFQFSLKRLFLFVLVVGGTIGWFAHKLDRKRRERAVVALLRSVGGEVRYGWQLDPELHRPPGPAWLRNILGDDYFAHPAHVDVRTSEYDLDPFGIVLGGVSTKRRASDRRDESSARCRRSSFARSVRAAPRTTKPGVSTPGTKTVQWSV